MRLWVQHHGVESNMSSGNGWETWTTSFSSLADLIGRLREMRAERRVHKLAIVAHGATQNSVDVGRVDLSPPDAAGSEILTSDTVDTSRLGNLLAELAEFIVPSGSLIFISCRAGGGVEGVELLKAVSRRLPGREVKGYVSWLVIQSHSRAGQVIDTLLGSPSVGRVLNARYPRIREGCPSERVARDGMIIWHPSVPTMWDQLQNVDQDLAGRIISGWLHARNRYVEVLRPSPMQAFESLEWTRTRHMWPWIVGYQHVQQVQGRRRGFQRIMVTRERAYSRIDHYRSVLRFYAVAHLYQSRQLGVRSFGEPRELTIDRPSERLSAR